MRSMQYHSLTYCLHPTASNGDIVTIGSRDKYYFTPSRRDGMAELYLLRFDGGRVTKVDQKIYEIKVFELSDCGNITYDKRIFLQTGDIILGVASSQTPPASQQGGSGCIPYLYIFRPLYERESNEIKNPTNRRTCTGGS